MDTCDYICQKKHCLAHYYLPKGSYWPILAVYNNLFIYFQAQKVACRKYLNFFEKIISSENFDTFNFFSKKKN